MRSSTKEKYLVSRGEICTLDEIKKHLKSDKPILIEFKHKHGTIFELINNYDSFKKCFLNALKNSDEIGYFYKPEKPECPSLSEDEIGKLKEGRVKELATEELEKYNKSLLQYKEDLEEYEWIKETLKIKNGELAFFILNRRSDRGYEYEEFKIHYMEFYK